MGTEKKTTPVFEYGTLDRTRKNIGEISEDEAAFMAKKLGGEIGIERETAEAAEKTKQRSSSKVIQKRKSNNSPNSSDIDSSALASANFSSGDKQSSAITTSIQLKKISSSEKNEFLKLYSSKNYRIITSFEYLMYRFFRSENVEKVSHHFSHAMLSDYITRVQNFNFAVTQLSEALPFNFQKLIDTDKRLYMRIFKTVRQCDLKPAMDELAKILKKTPKLPVTDLVPFVKLLYNYLIKLLFLSEINMTMTLEVASIEIEKITTDSSRDIKRYVRDAQREWKYVYHTVIKGLYPLVMRFCNTECVPMNIFFTVFIGKVLTFLEVTRFEILLPEKKLEEQIPLSESEIVQNENNDSVDQSNETNEQKLDAEKPPVDSNSPTGQNEKKQAILQAIQKSLDFANRMFPDAGWHSLKSFPDMYTYFQPLFAISEGFNLIDPSNPMQLATVLLYILEDLFSATHKIDFFSTEANLFDPEELTKSIQDWYLFRINLLEDNYFGYLRDYANATYTNEDFQDSPYGRKKLAGIFWHQQTYFLPYLKFDLSYMENETKKNKQQMVYRQVSKVTAIFTVLSANIDASLQKTGGKYEGTVDGILNPWDLYTVALSNISLRRLDILLGGKKSPDLNNANLIKAITCYLQIFNWWINDINSPAYGSYAELPYRRNETNEPVFSPPLRTDVKEVFVASMKKLLQEKNNE